MNTRQAKCIVARELEKHGLEHRLTARTVRFDDLARDRCTFVKIHGWHPSPLWGDLEAVAYRNGFCIESG